MGEAAPTQSYLMSSFAGGLVIKRGTSSGQDSCIELSNIHPEPDGVLRGRQGTAKINLQQLTDGTANANATEVHSHIVHGSVRYIGVGSKVKRGYDTGTDILTGMSGRRFTFASMAPSTAVSEQWTYMANGDGTATSHGAATGDSRKKDNGTLTRNWGIDGPAAAPTVALNASQPAITAIDDFASAYTAVDGTGTEGSDANFYATSARKFTVPQKKTERYRRMFSIGSLAVYTDQAWVRIMLKCNHTQFLDHVEVGVNVSGSTNFQDDYYWIRIPASSFQQDNNWQEFKFHETDFQRVRPTGGSTQGWANANGVQITVAGSAEAAVGSDVIVSADDMRLEASTHPEGTFDYKVTWWAEGINIPSNSRQLADIYNGLERISAQILAHRQGIDITRVSTTSDAQVTHWRLWRRNRDGAGLFQLVATIPYATTTYLDIKDDLELGEILGKLNAAGTQVEINHIPPTGRYAISFDNRMFVMGMSNKAFVGPITYAGAGLNDFTTGVVYTGQTQRTYEIVIDATGTPDTFKWRDTIGGTFTTGVVITGGFQTLSFGMTIKFAATTGHTATNSWVFTVVGTGDEESPYALRWSEKFYPDSFPLTNYELAGSPVDPIRAVVVWEGRMWIATKAHIWRVTPFNNTYEVEKTEAPIGTDSPYAFVSSPYGIFYYGSTDGPYLFNGSTSRSIAATQLEPFIHGETVKQDGLEIFGVLPETATEYENIVGAYYNRTYRVFLDDLDKTCRVFIYHCDRQVWHKAHGVGWEMRRFRWEKGESVATDVIDDLEGGTRDGWLIKYEPNGDLATDFGQESVLINVQHTFDAELKPSDREVDVKGVLVDVDTGGDNTQVMAEISVDDGLLIPLGMQGAFGRQKLFFPVVDGDGMPSGVIGYKASIRLSIWQKKVRVTLFGMGPSYQVEPRKDSLHVGRYTFTRSQGWCRRGNLLLRSIDAVLLTFYADNKKVHQTTLPSSQNTRQFYRVGCPIGVAGKQLEYRLESEEGFVVYPESYWEVAELDNDRQLQPWQLAA